MFWFLIALIGYLLLAVVFVLDKFILEKSVDKPIVYTFYSTIFMLVLLFGYLFGAESLTVFHWSIAIVSGMSFGFALWAMFKALSYGEASHITPFIGAVVSIGTFVGGSLFLQEQLLQTQLWGIAVLVVASFLFSFEKTENHSGIHIGFTWAIMSGILFAVSHVAAKYLYGSYSFFTALVTTKATVGIVGLITLCFPSVWRTLKADPSKKKNKKEKHSAVAIILSDKVLGIVAVLLIQYAISLGSVTIVNAMSGIQYVSMFFLIYVMSTWFPKVFREYFTKKEFVVEVFSLLLVVVGSILLVI